MVKLRNVDAATIMTVVQPMVSHDGLVAAYPQDNTLIITDDAYNVQRLLRIIGSLDVPNVQQTVAVIPLQLAFADDLAAQIQKIMTAREVGRSWRADRSALRPAAARGRLLLQHRPGRTDQLDHRPREPA